MQSQNNIKITELIAGPCSAETEHQTLATARAIARSFPEAIFRAGIWKPRTRPGCFEGVGKIGLPWLQRVKRETGLRTATEVAKAEHVEACLRHGIDMLWIGARSTVNPFSVQEIAEALKGSDIPVFIKNPVHADLSLWLGAVERLERMGIKRISAIHRGFHLPGKQVFRNDPIWNVALEFKRNAAHIPLYCDPSHICGNTQLIAYVTRKALELGMEGLMIETHINPAHALSDANQQLSPGELKELILNLGLTPTLAIQEPADGLSVLRKSVNAADERLLQILFERMRLVEEIGLQKRKTGEPVLQPKRWEEVLRSNIELAEAMGLRSSFIADMYTLIHEESLRSQREMDPV
jgi:chorismate mutase